MANAARVHAVERGKEAAGPHHDRLRRRGTRIHAARLAEKLGIRRVMVPSRRGRGLGRSASSMAPVAYEVVRRPLRPARPEFDPAYVNKLFAEMRAEAEAVVQGRRA